MNNTISHENLLLYADGMLGYTTREVKVKNY